MDSPPLPASLSRAESIERALAFYAAERTYVPQSMSDTNAWAIIDAPIHFDKGAKAREALSLPAPREATPVARIVAWTILGVEGDHCDRPYGSRSDADETCALWNREQYIGHPFHVAPLVRAPGGA